MSIERIIDYVIETPYNTNKAVLRCLLESLVEEVAPKDPAEEIKNREELIEAFESEEPKVNLKLVENLTLDDSLVIGEGKEVTLNLNSRKIETGAKYIIVDKGTLIIEGEGEITGTGRPIYVRNGGHLIINGGEIVSRNDCAVDVAYDGYVEFNDGRIAAQEVGILSTYGAHVIMNGGEVETTDNFCIGGNGNSGRGNTITEINGGKLKGHITSAGYVACGIYHPQDGILKITGGEIIADNGCGILMRAGVLEMTGGTVIGTGESGTKGKVGDSRVVVGPNGIVLDQLAHYPDNQNLEIKVQGGYVIGVDASVDILKDDEYEAKVTIENASLIPPYEDEEVIIYDGGDTEGN